VRRETKELHERIITELFQSTPFVRRETLDWQYCKVLLIFQSTPFVRRETIMHDEGINTIVFQSTPFVRRETISVSQKKHLFYISIHSLREKGDANGSYTKANSWYFNPLPSWEGRLDHVPVYPSYRLFQSTPFVRRETLDEREVIAMWTISIHSLREKGDHIFGSPFWL